MSWPLLTGWFRFVLLGQRPKDSTHPLVRQNEAGELEPVADEHTVFLPDGGGEIQALVAHVHRWDRCRWNGQLWYARCVALESCTAKIAC